MWPGYESLGQAFGQALCEQGDSCPQPSNTPTVLAAAALASFVGAVLSGAFAWRREHRRVGAGRGTLGAALLLIVSIGSVGFLLGVGLLLLIYGG